MKISINGIPGVGKSTIAAALASKLGLPHFTELFSCPFFAAPHSAHNDLHIFNYIAYKAAEVVRPDEYVEECDTEFTSRIFLRDELREYAYIKPADPSTRFIYLHAPLCVVLERIAKRARPGFVEVELALAEQRHEDAMDYITNSERGWHVVGANYSVEKIVEKILEVC
jgi:cytidylate kinase